MLLLLLWGGQSTGFNEFIPVPTEVKEQDHPCLVPNLPPITSVQIGSSATVCLDEKGEIWSFGQLGSLTGCHSYPTKISGIPSVRLFSFHFNRFACLCDDGSIWTFGKDEPAPVELPSSSFCYGSPPIQCGEMISISCGNNHTLFLSPEGYVFSCGNNDAGQLGQGDYTNHLTPTWIPSMKDCIQIACGGNISCMIDSSHRLWVCGSHTSFQNTPICMETIGLIQSISLGYKQSLCINQNGELWGWGDPYSGLGNDSSDICKFPIFIKANIQSVMCMGTSSFIRDQSGEVFCCGKNNLGQLGIGNTFNQLSFIKFPEEKFTMYFPVPRRKFSQKSARSAIP